LILAAQMAAAPARFAFTASGHRPDIVGEESELPRPWLYQCYERRPHAEFPLTEISGVGRSSGTATDGARAMPITQATIRIFVRRFFKNSPHM
jgi:hypothetical protein